MSKFFLLSLIFFLTSCYSLGKVSYPIYEKGAAPKNISKLHLKRGSDAFLNTINGKSANKTFFHGLGDIFLPYITLGYLEQVYLIPEGRVKLEGGVLISNSVTAGNTRYTNKTWRNKILTCNFESNNDYQLDGSFYSNEFFVKKLNSEQIICKN